MTCRELAIKSAYLPIVFGFGRLFYIVDHHAAIGGTNRA
ncbi:MAG: hypothetical protein PWQ39_1434 [Thermacetogenium sp.]|jgi:hypothetical protein|nr:hypothetical protein [Thermacetogenium sp.]